MVDGKCVLKRKGLRALAWADLVLVPDVETKERLQSGGVSQKITILEPTVNLARFEALSPIEKSVFKRYFSVKEGCVYAVAIGEYANKDALACFAELAKNNPNMKFYDLFYSPLVEDDVYRSALLGAAAFIKFGNSNDAVSLYEAFASKTPIIAIGENKEAPFLTNGKNSLMFQKASDVPNLLETLSKEEMQEIIITAYRQARDNALPIFGKKLRACYRELLKPKGGRQHD